MQDATQDRIPIQYIYEPYNDRVLIGFKYYKPALLDLSDRKDLAKISSKEFIEVAMGVGHKDLLITTDLLGEASGIIIDDKDPLPDEYRYDFPITYLDMQEYKKWKEILDLVNKKEMYHEQVY